jgi:hypothetical protein
LKCVFFKKDKSIGMMLKIYDIFSLVGRENL